MTQPTKKLNFDDETLDVLNGMDVSQNNGNWLGVLTCGQLERQLYVKVNKALEAMGGKWSRKAGGHIFPRDPREQLGGLLDNGYLTVVRDGYFPTPREIVLEMHSFIGFGTGLVLEPSAGEGHIADVLIELGLQDNRIHCVELDKHRASILRDKGYLVHQADFLNFQPFMQRFDRIYMNPPFENKQDIDHVRHAYDVLSSDGAMAAIMGEGTFFSSDNKRTDFRRWLNKQPHHAMKLTDGAFKESGTGVSARLVVIWK